MNAVQPVRAELDSLAHLEERITRAVELVSQLRAQNADLQQQLAVAIANRDSAAAERIAVEFTKTFYPTIRQFLPK